MKYGYFNVLFFGRRLLLRNGLMSNKEALVKKKPYIDYTNTEEIN